MEKADLPTDTAQEPREEAHQPLSEATMASSPCKELRQRKRGTSSDVNTQSSEVSSSKRNGSSQASPSQSSQPQFSQREHMLRDYRGRRTGLWAQCDDCDKWRYLPRVLDKHELPDKWYCHMNPDDKESDCSVPETPIQLTDELDLFHSEYSAGSVVWARMAPWSWWPAMVDDCPDLEQYYYLDGFSDIPTHYNVVFFDAFEVTRAWLTPQNLKPYGPNKETLKDLTKNNKYKRRLQVAFKQANDAELLPLPNRLVKYSFVARYKGPIGTPKKLSKKQIEKSKKKVKRSLNVDFSEDSESDSEGALNESMRILNKNVILLGSQKSPEAKRAKKPKLAKNPEGAKKNPDKILDKSIASEDAEDKAEKSLKSVEPVVNGVDQQPDSMSVQIGSRSIADTLPIDNDSSKTYIPESEIANTADSEAPKLHVRVATPSSDSLTSDDFDF